MAKETNWHKHVAIGTYILIGLAILTFVHPPDPAHPISIDFLSKSIVLPPWLALLIIAAVVAATVWQTKRSARVQGIRPAPGGEPIVEQAAEAVIEGLRHDLIATREENARLVKAATMRLANKKPDYPGPAMTTRGASTTPKATASEQNSPYNTTSNIPNIPSVTKVSTARPKVS